MKKNDGPAHRKIYAELDALIKKHYWDEDYILPAEKHFCEKYKVSRNTVRRAFFELEKESRIRRYRGKGTVINKATAGRSEYAKPRIVFILADYGAAEDYKGRMISAAIRTVDRLGGDAQIELMSGRQRRDLQAFKNQQERPIDGILYFPSTGAGDKGTRQELKSIIEMIEAPVVFMDKGILMGDDEEFFTSLVTSDNYYAVKKATTKFIEAGHRGIGYLTDGNEAGNRGLQERFCGYTDALRDAGLEPESFTLSQGHSGQNEDISATICARVRQENLTAMVCSYDQVAAWLLDESRFNRIRIPEDLSVLCASLLYRPYVHVPVAMIDQKAEMIGDAAAELLFRQIKSGKSGSKEKIVIGGEFLTNDAIRITDADRMVETG